MQIGNSMGVRIPKSVIEQCGLTDTLEMSVENGCLIISPVRRQPREGWGAAFKTMALSDDDKLFIDDGIEHSWDDSEWKWD